MRDDPDHVTRGAAHAQKLDVAQLHVALVVDGARAQEAVGAARGGGGRGRRRDLCGADKA